MNATQGLHTLAQGLWLDNITRHLLVNGMLKSYIGDLSVIGLTSNPTIFDHPIKSSTVYVEPIRDGLRRAKSDEDFGSSNNTLTWIVVGRDPQSGFLNTPAMAL